MTMNELKVDNFRKYYSDIHPLIFHRSVEHARTDAELFEILESIPKEYPIIWDAKSYRWEKSSLTLFEKFINLIEGDEE